MDVCVDAKAALVSVAVPLYVIVIPVGGDALVITL
jgi:hypothetical protein